MESLRVNQDGEFDTQRQEDGAFATHCQEEGEAASEPADETQNFTIEAKTTVMPSFKIETDLSAGLVISSPRDKNKIKPFSAGDPLQTSSFSQSQSQQQFQFQNSIAYKGIFTNSDILDAYRRYEKYVGDSKSSRILSVSQNRLVEADENENQVTENTYLILAGMALVNQNDRLSLESVVKFAQERQKLQNFKIKDMQKLTPELTNLLQLTLQVAVINKDASLCKKTLQWQTQQSIRPVLNQETVSLALSHEIKGEKEQQHDFTILKQLLNHEVAITMNLFLDSILDESKKKHIRAIQVLQGLNKKRGEKEKLSRQTYYSRSEWEVENSSPKNNTLPGLSQSRSVSQNSPSDTFSTSQSVKITKICTLVDYVEIILPIVLQNAHLENRVCSMILELNDGFENDQLTNLLLHLNLYKIILNVIEKQKNAKMRRNFTAYAFTNAFITQKFSFAARLILDYQPTILQEQKIIMPLILPFLYSNPYHMELKIDILKIFMPYMLYRNVEQLIEIVIKISEDSDKSYGVIVNNINPLMVSSQIIELNHLITEQFPLSKIRIGYSLKLLQENVSTILDNFNLPRVVQKWVKQRDLQGVTVLEKLSALNQYKILQSTLIDRIIRDYWNSKVDICGDLLEVSSAYQILKYGDFSYDEDFESYYRYYNRKEILKNLRPHLLTFRVWAESMNFRYFIEFFVYLCCVVGFQFLISEFNSSLHTFNHDKDDLEAENEQLRRLLQGNTTNGTGFRALSELIQEAAANFTQNVTDTIEQHLKHKEELEAIERVEIERLVQLIDDAQYLGYVAFTFMIQIVSNFIFCYLTKRKFHWQFGHLIDIGAAVAVFVWLIKHEQYIRAQNEGFGLDIEPTHAQMYLQEVLNHINDESFNLDFLLAAVAFFFWIRLLMMFQLTETFGPLIVIVQHMMKDLLVFLVLFIIQIIAFSAVGILLFGDVPVYFDLGSAAMNLFQYIVGNFDLTIYDNQTSSRQVLGKIFSVIVMVFNLIILMNLLIALMSDTYQFYKKLDRGLIFKKIIEAIPKYKYDSTYGCLISLPPPLNVLNIFVMPFFLLKGFQRQKKTVNRWIMMIAYLPIAVISTTFFVAVNLVLLPFAYIKSLFHKVKIVLMLKQKEDLKELLRFLLYGQFILIIGQIYEVKSFFQHLYAWDQTEKVASTKIIVVPFQVFRELLKHLELISKRHTKMNAVELVKEIQENMKISFHMQRWIFGSRIDMLTNITPERRDSDEKDSIEALKTFNLIKQVIWNFTIGQSGENRSVQEVNIEAMIAMLMEIEFKIQLACSSKWKFGNFELSDIEIHSLKNHQIKKYLARFNLIYPETVNRKFTNLKHISKDDSQDSSD